MDSTIVGSNPMSDTVLTTFFPLFGIFKFRSCLIVGGGGGGGEVPLCSTGQYACFLKSTGDIGREGYGHDIKYY